MSNIYDNNFDIWGANPGSALMAIALCCGYATTVNNNGGWRQGWWQTVVLTALGCTGTGVRGACRYFAC